MGIGAASKGVGKVLSRFGKKNVGSFADAGNAFMEHGKRQFGPAIRGKMLEGTTERWNPWALAGIGLGTVSGLANAAVNDMEAEKRLKALSALGVNVETGVSGPIRSTVTEKSIDKHFKTLGTARANIKKTMLNRLQSLSNPPGAIMELGTDYIDHTRNMRVDEALSNLKSNIYLRRMNQAASGEAANKAWNKFELQDESFYR